MPVQDGTYQSSYGQNFQTGINTPAGNTGRPDFAYQKYYDDINNRWRAFRNLAEAHAWVTPPKIGQLRIVQVGYTALNNGVYTGGLETPFIYIGGVTVDNLVELKLGGNISGTQQFAVNSEQTVFTPTINITNISVSKIAVYRNIRLAQNQWSKSGNTIVLNEPALPGDFVFIDVL